MTTNQTLETWGYSHGGPIGRYVVYVLTRTFLAAAASAPAEGLAAAGGAWGAGALGSLGEVMERISASVSACSCRIFCRRADTSAALPHRPGCTSGGQPSARWRSIRLIRTIRLIRATSRTVRATVRTVRATVRTVRATTYMVRATTRTFRAMVRTLRAMMRTLRVMVRTLRAMVRTLRATVRT
eukprot:1190837-Prorocentrum_minimum.AAC.1